MDLQQVKQLAIDYSKFKSLIHQFACDFFSEYVFDIQLHGKTKHTPDWFDDDVSIVWADEEGFEIRYDYFETFFGESENRSLEMTFPIQVLVDYEDDPRTTAFQLAFDLSADRRKELAELEQKKWEKEKKEKESAKNKRYAQYLKLRDEFLGNE